MVKRSEISDAILTHVPISFFKENNREYLWGKEEVISKRMELFQKWYLKRTDQEHPIFYHYISDKPVYDVSSVFICWGGKVQIKTQVVEFRYGTLNGFSAHDRWWMVTGGPVIKAPEDMLMKGFRGFRYTENLF